MTFGNKCAKASDCSQGCSRDHCRWSWPTGGSKQWEDSKATCRCDNIQENGKPGKSLVFNYCTYVDGTSGVFGLYRTGTDASKDVVVANEGVTPLSAHNMREDSNDDTSEITGIRFSQGSDTKCASDASKTYSLVTELTCDEG